MSAVANDRPDEALPKWTPERAEWSSGRALYFMPGSVY